MKPGVPVIARLWLKLRRLRRRPAAVPLPWSMPDNAPVIADKLLADVRMLAAIAYEEGRAGVSRPSRQAMEIWARLCKGARS